MMKTKKIILLILVLILSFSLSGCFGSYEINDLAMVMSVGIDKGKKPGTVQVTAQIARPANARGQSGSPSAGTGEPIWTASAEGDSIFEAIRNLGRFTSRRIFWAHNFLLVISEDYAKDGIVDIIDFFTRNHQMRLRTWVVVTPKKANEIIATKTGLEIIPGESIDQLFRYNEIIAEAPRTDIRRLASAYMSNSSHPVLAKVDLIERDVSAKQPEEFGSTPQVKLSGSAIFNRDKMVGWLSPTESRGLLWFIESVDNAIVKLECPSQPKKPVSIELKKNKFEVTPLYSNGEVSFKVDLITYADLVELGCSTEDETKAIIKQLEPALEKELKSEIKSVIEKAQRKYKVDFLKLGETFENRYPAEWNSTFKDRWEEYFPSINMQVKVEAHINSSRLLQKPTRPVED